MSFEYFTILAFTFFVALFIQKKNHIHLFNSAKARFLFISFFFIFGTLWDTITIYRGGWIIPVEKTLGITIGLMPLEDYLFMLIGPYLVITIYKLIDNKLK